MIREQANTGFSLKDGAIVILGSGSPTVRSSSVSLALKGWSLAVASSLASYTGQCSSLGTHFCVSTLALALAKA